MAVDKPVAAAVVGVSSLADVLDRILDKGIVIDAWVRVAVVGIELLTVEVRVVVASVETYLKFADAISKIPLVSQPQPVANTLSAMGLPSTR